MKLTEEQIERARMVNLPDFLMSHGVELKKTGRSYVMKEHDSLNIKDNGPGEAGKWYRFSTSEGGDNISFVQQYMNCSFVEAVELLNNERYDREFQPQYRNSERKEKTENRTDISIDENTDMKRVFAYLCSTRGLNSDIISELASQGKISQEAVTGNIIFKVFDENNKLVGAEKTGTSTQHKYKGIATGSAAGYGFELSTGRAEKTVFFESSIDLLSFYQMYRNILDNHRLVSMMGVKPYIVTETMQRYGIPPENVFLASDNDKAGNEFAERLMQEYPEMKRMKTPDRYKDWNDYIRNIPKEQEKAKEEQQMVTYGNEIWNKATDNKDKSLVTMYEDTFLDLQKKLDETGINYFAYVRDNIVTMAVNDKDTAWLSKIADLDSLSTQKSDVEYSPPEKNVFGNTEYRYIPQKEYISLDSDSALKMADMLNSQNISFSGRVYANGKGTLTVSRSDLDAVKAIQNDLAEMRKNYATVEKKSEIIGNTAYRDIKEKQYVYSKLTPEKYMEIKPALDEAVNYSGLIRDSRVIFTVDKKDFQLFNDKIAELTVKPDKEVEIRSDNTAEIPFDRKFAAEIKTVKDEMRLHDNLMELASVSAGNNDVYDFHFSEDLMEEIKKTGNEEFINTLIPNGVLDDRLMMEIFEDVYKELFSQGQALAAEETGMDNLRRPVKLPDTVGIKFTQHHPSSPELDSFINDTMADKEISFALASAVIEYLDDKHRYERINVPELEWYHEIEFALNVLIDSNHLSYSARYDIGEGKYTGGGSLSDFIAYDAKELHSRDKIDDNTLSFITDTVVPFLKDHSQLTNEEQKIFDDFKARHPVRQSERESRSEKNNSPEKEEPGSYFRIYQLKDGDEYHYARFTDYQTNKDAGANLNISDYDLKYEDNWDEVPGISSEMKLDAIFHRFNTNHPNDFTGHSLSVSDVIVVGNEDSQTAYYVDDFGFTDFPEFFKEKEKTISHEDISEPDTISEKSIENKAEISDNEVSNAANSWKAYIIPDLSTWAISTEKNTPIERFDNIDDALKRFAELRKEPYNSENKPNPWDNSSMARLTIGLESTDGVNAADIVHVRDGKNYLVDDFTRLDRMNSQQSFMDVVKKIADTVGIDRINVFEKDEDGKFLPPKDIEFSEWNNTFFKYEHVPDDDDDPGSGSGPAAPAAAEKKDESDDLETAKQLINRFCIEEYDSEADFSDLTNIGLAYTTNDDEQEIQVSANLVEFSLNTYVDGKLIDSEMYASIADMNENFFADMDFNELISTGMLYEEEKSEILEDKPLFTDASVIEEIQKNEKSSEGKPESEIMSGDQLNMFSDPVPLSESGSLNPV
ncbi:MAG: YodL domain-containing protein [Oscillospiraceae bacterium]